MSSGWAKTRDMMLGALFASPQWVGIFHGAIEEDDPAYRRQMAQFRQDGESGDMRIFSNGDDVPWPPLKSDSDSDATGWALFDAEIGGERVTPIVPFPRPRRLLRSDNYVARAGELRVAIP